MRTTGSPVPTAHLLRILTGDASGDDVASGHGGVGRVVEADGSIAPWALPIQQSDVFYPM